MRDVDIETSDVRAFHEAGPELDVLASELEESDDSAEVAPAVRDLARPRAWNAPASPGSALEAHYASAARWAREILNRESPGPP